MPAPAANLATREPKIRSHLEGHSCVIESSRLLQFCPRGSRVWSGEMSLSKPPCEIRSDDLCKLSVEELMQQATTGRLDAMAILFDRYHRLVFDVAFRIVRDPGEAEDVVQNVFLDVFRAMANFDPRKGILKVWVL